MHPDTLRSMSNLVDALDRQGKYAEAERLHQQCLEARKTSLGEMHPNTLRSMRNLTDALKNQGKYAEAEMLHRQCLEARKT
eukprot:9450630-Ditylum_brightwellii.AAC.1